MLKFLKLVPKIPNNPIWRSSLLLSYKFQTIKYENKLAANLLKPLQLSFKPQNFVGGHQKKSSQTLFKRWKIIKGDKVIVLSGKDKGKTGVVLRVYRKQNKVLVGGINTKMKRVATDIHRDSKGGIRPIIHPIHVSKVALIDPETGKATRIKYGYLADGTKVRVSKKSGSIISRPENPAWQVKVRNKKKVDGLMDTPPNIATEVTYKGENFDRIKKDFEEYIQKKEKREKLLVFDE